MTLCDKEMKFINSDTDKLFTSWLAGWYQPSGLNCVDSKTTEAIKMMNI